MRQGISKRVLQEFFSRLYLHFCLISLRTKQGIHFFPRMFFLLFSIFHFYNFSFPFGFSYAALATSMCFMMHSMLFFWHRYELPAVALGRITPERPRQGMSSPPPSPTSSTPSVRSDSGRSTTDVTVPLHLRPHQEVLDARIASILQCSKLGRSRKILLQPLLQRNRYGIEPIELFCCATVLCE